ncbi:MAG: outer membrane beta-barrel protein [Alistipes sp.]|nr:outer membrane beta-barrel protein [Alistipes sp.]
MKKIFLSTITILVLSICNANAQKQGDVYFGGTIGVGTSTMSVSKVNTSNFQATITPEVGFFIADKLRLSINLSYGLVSEDGDITHALTAGPTLAYYLPICENLYYTPHFEIGFSYANYGGYEFAGFGVGISALGLEFRPTQHFGFSADLLSFNYIRLLDNKYTINNFNFGLAINPTIGFKYYF